MADPDLSINIPFGGGGGGGFGAAITEQLTNSIKNMDLVSTMQKMIDSLSDDEESKPIRDKLQNVIEKYSSLSAEEKAEFINQVRDGLTSKIGQKLQESGALNKLDEAIRGAIMTKLYMVGAGIVLVVILLVFFGYKLYKSIKDKEKKKEEKKKLKQLKKKK